MGICMNKEAREQLAQSQRIDKTLKAKNKLIIKLLLLGPGESGKSTVLKQMKIIHKNGFSEEELRQTRGLVRANMIQCMTEILQAMSKLEILLDDPGLEEDAESVSGLRVKTDDDFELLEPQTAATMARLWRDGGVQRAFDRRNEFQLADCAKFFLDSIARIADAAYAPTEQDVLHVRVATIGVVEMQFEHRRAEFRVIDVGGQKSERRKWIHQFDGVDAIIFIVALSEYDQCLREDDSVNRMDDSLRLFGDICNSKWFVAAAMILFLNKKDLFAEKIARTPLKTFFDDYTGSNEYEECAAFVQRRFEALNEGEKKVFAHQTCATDTNQLQLVLANVTDLVVSQNLKGTGVD